MPKKANLGRAYRVINALPVEQLSQMSKRVQTGTRIPCLKAIWQTDSGKQTDIMIVFVLLLLIVTEFFYDLLSVYYSAIEFRCRSHNSHKP